MYICTFVFIEPLYIIKNVLTGNHIKPMISFRVCCKNRIRFDGRAQGKRKRKMFDGGGGNRALSINTSANRFLLKL